MEKASPPSPLLGMNLKETGELCAKLGMPSFSAAQICGWLYRKAALSIEDMTNISKKNRALLARDHVIGRRAPVERQVSRDGTIKYLFQTEDALLVEAVYIPEGKRGTLCISSQAGCRRGCRFCMTGQQGLQGQLGAAEILNQIFSVPEFEQLTNIVYMGMGEPLDNPGEVLRSLADLTSPWGLGWSPKRITLSTIGILPELKRFLKESRVHLAVSLHNPIPRERLKIMPVEKKYPFKEVLHILKDQDFSGQRRLSFEYILFRNFNDTAAHADALAALLKGLECRINLIRFHSFPGAPFEGSDEQRILAFQRRLKARGLTCTLRVSRGQDILAACGMLSTKEAMKKEFRP